MESASLNHAVNGSMDLRPRQLMPDPEHNDTQAPLLLGVCGSLTLFAVVLLFARLWSRVRSFWNVHMDDWTAVAATVLSIAEYIIVCLACAYGFGQRAKYVSAASRLAAMRLIFLCQAVWNVSIALVKISVALLLLRIKQTRAWRIFLYSTIVLLILTAIASTLFQFLQCRPFSSYWDPGILLTGKVECVSQQVILGNIVAASAVHISTDLIFSLIPITFIRKLHRPRGEKIFLGVLMGLGLFASSFAILRTAGANMLYTSRDTFRLAVMPTLWSMLELELALIAASIPTLKSFMQQTLVKAGHSFYDEKTETQVRNRLVELGFLDPNSDKFVEMERELFNPNVGDVVATVGSAPKPQQKKNQYVIMVEGLSNVESESHGTTRDLRAFGP